MDAWLGLVEQARHRFEKWNAKCTGIKRYFKVKTRKVVKLFRVDRGKVPRKDGDIKKEKWNRINPERINMEYYAGYTKAPEDKHIVIVQRGLKYMR